MFRDQTFGTKTSEIAPRHNVQQPEQENLWEYYFECFARLKQRVDVRFVLTAEGFGQELSSGLEAIREALVNMLQHADYFSPGHPRIRIFTSHIEFYNPGGLPKPLKELRTKDISLPRNPIITKLFRMAKLAENAGFGFDKIDDKRIAYNNTKPEYDIEFDAVIPKMQVQEETIMFSGHFGTMGSDDDAPALLSCRPYFYICYRDDSVRLILLAVSGASACPR